MSERKLWEIHEELVEAVAQSQLAPTDINARRRAETLIGQWCSLLGEQVDVQLAFRYEHAYHAFITACDRHQALVTHYELRGGLHDDADVELLTGTKKDLDQAIASFDAVAVEVSAALERPRR